MYLRDLIFALVLHLSLLYAAPALAQSSVPIAAAVVEQSGFDYDQALALSQAAIGKPVSDVQFTASDGRRVTFGEFRGKPLVVSLVYTSCYQICPMTTRFLSEVVDKARGALGDDSFAIAVIGFDTQVDTPVAMQYFANNQGVGDKG